MCKQKVIILLIVTWFLAGCAYLPIPNIDPAPTNPTAASPSASPDAPSPTASADNQVNEFVTATNVPVESVVETATPTPTPTLTPTPRPAYSLQPGSPVGIVNFQESACSWMGIGGQVFGLNEQPVLDLVVEIGGNINGNSISFLGLTGSTNVLGPGSYLITIASQPAASDGTLWIQLKSLSGQLLSDKLNFRTYADCSRNLILLNFSASSQLLLPRAYLPMVLDRQP